MRLGTHIVEAHLGLHAFDDNVDPGGGPSEAGLEGFGGGRTCEESPAQKQASPKTRAVFDLMPGPEMRVVGFGNECSGESGDGYAACRNNTLEDWTSDRAADWAEELVRGHRALLPPHRAFQCAQVSPAETVEVVLLGSLSLSGQSLLALEQASSLAKTLRGSVVRLCTIPF